MKTALTLAFTVLATSALGNAQGSGISGHYKVLQSDCAPFLLSTNQGTADVSADSRGLVVTSDVGTNVFSFPVGSVKESCLGDCYSIYQSHFLSSTRFQDIRLFADTNSSTPVPAGETDFVLNGNQLTITTTDDGQLTPAAPTTCVLSK